MTAISIIALAWLGQLIFTLPGRPCPLYVAHGLALLTEIRTWCCVEKGAVTKNGYSSENLPRGDHPAWGNSRISTLSPKLSRRPHAGG
jgi:hypothetical protein